MNIIKRKSFFYKFFSLVLLISVFLLNFGSSKALLIENNKQYATNNQLQSDEITEYRTEYEKHFQNEDGTITAATYTNPIHYKDSDGNWVDIDNSLIDSNEVDEDGNKIFTNKDNPLKVKLSNKAKDKKFVSIKLEKYEINWGIQGVDKVKGNVEESGTKENVTDITSISSKMTYKDVFENTSLVYKLSSYALMEELVFDEVPTYDNVVYNVETKNLVAKSVGKEVIFYDADESEKEVFKFEAPFMYDSNEKPSFNENVGVTLEETSKGYIITHIFDMEWLEDESRIYPVVLDPVVSSYQHYSNIEDTHTNSQSPNTNYVNNPYLQIGKINGDNYVWVKITNMPTLPSEAVVTDARLGLFLNYGTNSWGALELWAPRTAWDSYTMTWNWQNNVGADFVANGIYPVANGSYYKYNINVTNNVTKWYNGTAANWGFMLKYQDLNYNDCNWLYSSDNTGIGSTYLPAITITYAIPLPPNNYVSMNWHYPLNTSFNILSRGWSSTHHALDFIVSTGNNIYAVDGGVVVDRIVDVWKNTSSGNYVAIRTNSIDPTTGEKLVIGYMHMSTTPPAFGTVVTKGQKIGETGETGYDCSGPHLHIEVIKDGSTWTDHSPTQQSKTVDPKLFWPNILN